MRASRADLIAFVLFLVAAAVAPAWAAELPVGMMAVPALDPVSGEPLVALLVEVPAAPLLALAADGDASAGVVEGEVWALAEGADGATVDAFVQPFRLAAGDSARGQGEIGLKLLGSLRLPPGSYRLQVTVSSASGLSGAAATPLTVPDFGAGEPAASTPLFPERRQGWRLVHQAGPPHPLELAAPAAGAPWVPSVVGEVALGEATSFHLLTHHVGDWGSGLDVQLFDQEGRATPVAVRVLERRDGAVSGQLLVRVALEAEPPAPGLYWLELGVPGVARRVRAPVRFVADAASPWWQRVEAAAAPPVGLFEAAGPQEAAPEEDMPPSAEEGEQPVEALPAQDGRARQEMAARYRDALRALADGDRDRALDRLRALERAAAAPTGPGLGPLRRVQRGVIEELGEKGAAPLPVIDLHARLDPGYLARDEARLSAENRVFVAELVGRWVAGERTADARRLGGLLLAAMGAAHQALEIDPSSSLALLRLSMAAERAGQLETAASYLLRLLDGAPSDLHARIRLAVVLRRLGRADEARAALSALTAPRRDAPEAPRWIVALAFEELAMIERAAGRVDLAEATLRRGIEQTGAQSLHLLRAYYLDLLQRQGDSVGSLDRLSVAGSAAEAAARHRYSGPPESELAAARRDVARAVEERFDRLRAALREESDQPAEGR
jgi:tetratricopeptide (TPR) repeat protein